MARDHEEEEHDDGVYTGSYDTEIQSGSAGYGYGSIANESTASLGLNQPISDIVSEVQTVFDDTDHNDHPHLSTIQFVGAKMYHLNHLFTKAVVRLNRVSQSVKRMYDGNAMLSKPWFFGGSTYGPNTQDIAMYTNFSYGITGSLKGGDVSCRHLTATGKVNIKGSDITMMSGSITASGDISSSGNIYAGAGATGSFDHIITLNDTIEFKSKTNRNQVLGRAKFDPVDGFIVESASYGGGALRGTPAVSTVMPRIADKLADDRTIGGTVFNGTANITPATSSHALKAASATSADTAGTATYATKVGNKAANFTFLKNIKNNQLTISDGTHTWVLNAQ